MKNLIVICMLVLGVANIAKANIITVNDDFDNGVLAPNWSVSFVNSTGWSYAESGTNLTVTSINPTVINSSSGGTWATVILSQTFSPLTDFDVDFDFSWISTGSLLPMERVGIHLYDSVGVQIAEAQYGDYWAMWRGEKRAIAGGNSFSSGSNTMPYDGTASVDISRVGNSINVLWDGSNLVSGTSSTALSRVDLEFNYYAYNGIYGLSFFDSESIDLVRIQGQVVPVPSAVILSILGLVTAGVKLRKRNEA